MTQPAVSVIGCTLLALHVASCGDAARAAEAAPVDDSARDEVVAGSASTLARPASVVAPVAVRDAHRRARDDARLVLERYCGSCHISAYESALPGALAVYDLFDEEWASRATDLQLRDIVFRLGEPLGPDAEPLAVPAAERDAVERYVDAEIARRAAASGLDPTAALPPTAGEAP